MDRALTLSGRVASLASCQDFKGPDATATLKSSRHLPLPTRSSKSHRPKGSQYACVPTPRLFLPAVRRSPTWDPIRALRCCFREIPASIPIPGCLFSRPGTPSLTCLRSQLCFSTPQRFLVRGLAGAGARSGPSLSPPPPRDPPSGRVFYSLTGKAS